MPTYNHIACVGLGLANACLINELRSMGFTGHISVLEKATAPDTHKRWCTWKPLPSMLRDIHANEWQAWTIKKRTEQHSLASVRHAYTEIKASDFWEVQLARLNSDPHTSIHYSTDIANYKKIKDLPLPQSAPLDLIIDSRSIQMANSQYQQQFVGWMIETRHASFDPESAQLMHFTEETDRIAFLYCLPYSETRALVEYTTFQFGAFSREQHTFALKTALNERYRLTDDQYTLLSKEAASLPMGSYPHPKPLSGYWPIGIRGGAIRGSSGYGLLSICEQAKRYADSILKGMARPKAPPVNHHLTQYLDRIFIRAIRKNPQLGQDCFLACARKLNSQQFVELMRGELSFASALKVIASMPTYTFLKALF